MPSTPELYASALECRAKRLAAGTPLSRREQRLYAGIVALNKEALKTKKDHTEVRTWLFSQIRRLSKLYIKRYS